MILQFCHNTMTLGKEDIRKQATHLKNMSLGKYTPYTYGDFSASSEYDQSSRLIHSDGFGIYARNNEGERRKKFTRGVYSVGDGAIEQACCHDACKTLNDR